MLFCLEKIEEMENIVNITEENKELLNN